jgi:hypothetical protein
MFSCLLYGAYENLVASSVGLKHFNLLGSSSSSRAGMSSLGCVISFSQYFVLKLGISALTVDVCRSVCKIVPILPLQDSDPRGGLSLLPHLHPCPDTRSRMVFIHNDDTHEAQGKNGNICLNTNRIIYFLATQYKGSHYKRFFSSLDSVLGGRE